MTRTKFSITSRGVIQRLTNVGSFNWRGVTCIVHFTEIHQNDSDANYSTTAIQLNNWGSFHQGNFLFPCGFHVKHRLCSHSRLKSMPNFFCRYYHSSSLFPNSQVHIHHGKYCSWGRPLSYKNTCINFCLLLDEFKSRGSFSLLHMQGHKRLFMGSVPWL